MSYLLNPLAMTEHDASTIMLCAAKRQKAEGIECSEVAAHTFPLDYTKSVAAVMQNLEFHAQQINKDEPTSEVQQIAAHRLDYKHCPDKLAEMDAIDRTQFAIYQDSIARQACAPNAICTQRIIKGFAQKHNLELPTKEWSQASDIAFVEQTKTTLEQVKNGPDAAYHSISIVQELMERCEPEFIQKYMDLKGFWKEMGKNLAQLELEQVNGPEEFPFDKRCAMTEYRTALYWGNYPDYIVPLMQEGMKEVYKDHHKEWCKAVDAELAASKNKIDLDGKYPESYVESVMLLMETVPQQYIDTYCVSVPISTFWQDCGRAVEQAEIDMEERKRILGLLCVDDAVFWNAARFVELTTEASERKTIGAFVSRELEEGRSPSGPILDI